ncbi:MAG TPA: hypothetical protein VG013_20795 [Gemmataceae bacterium]|jgi:hypothetical protein|nr:hypothetical protein [Gemmataceae bacterium]
MLARLARLSLAPALLLAALAALAMPTTASAADNRVPELRPGICDGIWHTDQVKVVVEEVCPDGRFSGVVHFAKSSRWPDYCFNFNGQVGRRGALTLTRVGDNCTQVAHTDAPCRERGAVVWHGDVAGDGLDRPLAFELRMPMGR